MLLNLIPREERDCLDEELLYYIEQLEEKASNVDALIDNILKLNKYLNKDESILELLEELSTLDAVSDDISDLVEATDTLMENFNYYDLKFLKDEYICDCLEFLSEYSFAVDDLSELYEEMKNYDDISYAILYELSSYNIDSNILVPTYLFMRGDYGSYDSGYCYEFSNLANDIYRLGSDKGEAAEQWYKETASCEVAEALELIEETIEIDWEKNFDNVFEGMDVLEIDGYFFAKNKH